ncbi:sodium-dependent transporter family protein [Parvularcula bermudensis HTCC2503]|uniref:Sodium-dependent transporter family protein n=1 Tax=Parvularcula bermudensis (strain ATCC BAA-594 / HTCC2503 / KCTC 12087) TaxID=314260 RepID=E0TB75_PARBH|nr:sodium-dependent transporter [Parvularcula bermudensis]ADM08279.1 sodium-dependent transporter family protein [Parvularcula bermudensis HTCC2503]
MAVAGTGQSNENWSGRAAFILAAVGSAVGLGNLVRFPYVAGDSGGGAFIFVYLATILFIGVPVLIAEFMIGRRGGGSAIAAVSRLARTEGRTRAWVIFPILGILASFLIVSYYSVLAGWILHFIQVFAVDIGGRFVAEGPVALTAPAFEGQSDEEIGGILPKLLSQPGRMIVLHALFMAATVFILSRGVKSGIEAAANVMMPIFFVLLLGLTTFSLVTGEAMQALTFLFTPDFSQLTGSTLLRAVGQAFFSLSLGAAMMLTYGTYLSRETDIKSSSQIVATADTAVALIAGLALFPIVFASPVLSADVMGDNDPGLGLLFVTVPRAFHLMPFGSLFGLAFFVMALFAALTSAIALLETSVSWADGDYDVPPAQKARRRVIGAICLGGLAFLIGIGHALSQVPQTVAATFFNDWSPLDAIPLFQGMNFLDAIDALATTVLQPFVGMITALFAGWAISTSAAKEELRFDNDSTFALWQTLVRWVAPIAVGLVLLYGAIIVPLLD